ncbi:unnamed protein product [Closterium sp. NIES-64]|nr:unnamed protein product [Closterium sp. NIES-64]
MPMVCSNRPVCSAHRLSNSRPVSLTARVSEHMARPAKSLRQEEQLRRAKEAAEAASNNTSPVFPTKTTPPGMVAGHGVAELLPDTPLTRHSRVPVGLITVHAC